MAPNFKEGKTEAILDLHGKGSHTQLRELIHQDMFLDLGSDIITSPLRIVDRYRHLGTWLTTGMKLIYDLKSKFAIAHTTITKYRTAIFGNPALALQRKIQLFRSLVVSAIIFNIGAWHSLRPVEYRHFIAGFYRLYRRLAILQFGNTAMPWSHDKLCYSLGIEPPFVYLAIGRLRFVQQLIRDGQPQLWGLLQQSDTWWDLLYAHFDWLLLRIPHFTCPHPRTDWAEFANVLSRPGNYWKNILRKAQFFEIQYHALRYEWNAWHLATLQRLTEVYCLPDAAALLQHETDFCLRCRQTFARPAAWAVHAFKKHQRVTSARLYASGTQCSACLKQYANYPALVNHLRYSVRCLQHLQTTGPPMTPEPGLNSRAEQRERRPLHLPSLQAEGPLHQPEVQYVHDVTHEVRALLDAWTLSWASTTGLPPVQRLDGLRQATCQTILPRSEILSTLDYWISCDLPEDLCTLDVFDTISNFRSCCTFSWFYPDLPSTTTLTSPNVDELLACFHSAFARSVQLRTLNVCYRPVCLAHLFSGHRRQYDIQSYAEIWGGALQGAKVLSVDIIFDVQTADLADPEKLQLFIRAIREGLLHAFVAGPPCESWSVARETDDNGPRPLRSSEALSGKDGLTFRELRQVSTGNALLGATLRLFLEALLSCTFALVEHPAEPCHKPTAPSIWKLPIIKLFEKFTNCDNILIYQGYYGAYSPKPTQFLLANSISGAAAFLAQFQSTLHLPTSTSIGRNADGEWRTMRLKAYPPALCKGIVGLAEASLAKRQWEQAHTDTAWFEAAISSLCCTFNFEAGLGPDFAG